MLEEMKGHASVGTGRHAAVRQAAKPRVLGGKRQSAFWRIGGDISRPATILLMIASLLAPLLIWALIVELGLVSRVALPSPVQVIQGARDMAADGTLGSATWTSVRRILIGFGISMAISIPLGLAMGS